MLARYRDLTETILKYATHRERLIRTTVMALIPRLAAFSPDRFVLSYLPQVGDYLLAAVQRANQERGPAFLAVGHLAGALEGTPKLAPLLPTIAAAVADALAKKRKVEPCPEAITCTGALSTHMRRARAGSRGLLRCHHL